MSEKIARNVNIDPATLENLEILSPDYHAALLHRYGEWRAITDDRMADGTIHEGYRHQDFTLELMPMMERIKAADRVYQLWQDYELDPDVVFIPNLTHCFGKPGVECGEPDFKHWDKLLKKYEDPTSKQHRGAMRTWNDTMLDPTLLKSSTPYIETYDPDMATYDIAIASQFLFRDITTNGRDVFRDKGLFDLLEDLRKQLSLPILSHPRFSNEELLIKQFSPAETTYFAVQLARLERGETLFGANERVIGKESMQGAFDDPKNIGPLFFYVNPNGGPITTSLEFKGDQYENVGGFCPTVRGFDLVRNM